jgi:tripartite-type tricarboxylate transporter receptor subunit TctC
VRALAICAPQRHSLVPELPTVVEAGVPGYGAASTGGLFAPLGTPASIIARLGAVVGELVENAAFREQLARSGCDARFSGPAELGEIVQQESAHWADVVRQANISAS